MLKMLLHKRKPLLYILRVRLSVRCEPYNAIWETSIEEKYARLCDIGGNSNAQWYLIKNLGAGYTEATE